MVLRLMGRMRGAVGLAAVVVLALGGAACGSGGTAGPGAGGGATSTTTGVSTPTTARAVDYGRPAQARRVGTGFLDGVSLDGSAAYVEEERPEFSELGCEGQPQPVLARLSLAGSEREVLATPDLPIRGEVVHGPGRRVVLADGCEGFLSRLVVGTETPDGRLRDLRPVDFGDGGPPINPSSISWSRDGGSLLAAQSSASGSALVVRVDPTTGTTTSLFPVPGVGRIPLRVAELDGGSIAVVGGGRAEVLGADGRPQSSVEGNDFTVAPDGRSLLVFGRALGRLEVGGGRLVPLVPAEAGREITSAELSPDGRAVVYLTSADGGADNRVRVVSVADRRVVDLTGPGQWGRVLFSGDGRRALFNQFFDDPRFVPDVMAVDFEA